MQNIDPTLLLEEKDYNELISTRNNKEKFIVYYFFDYNPMALHFTQKLSRKYGYKILYYSSKCNRKEINYNDKSFFYKNPKDFLWYVKNAEFVISHSFHATVFSILFKKPFYSFLTNETGSRVESLCNLLGLTDRILRKAPKLSETSFDIDYTSVYQKLNTERENSYNFLKEALGIKSGEELLS